MLITKQNIKDLAQFTLNIEDRIINPNIEDSQEYDLKPTIGDAMFDKLIEDFDGGLIPWDILTAYAIGDFVVYGKIVYKALTANVGSQPDLFPFDWEVNELGTFFNKYLRPFIVFATYQQFLLWIGRNLTQYGLREMLEDTSIPVTEEGRAALIADARKKRGIWYNRLENELCKKNRTFDGVQYLVDCEVYKPNPKQTYKIRPIK
jgi:hypothetical protein